MISHRPAIPASHRQVLSEALRAPSAHNAQPWRLAVGPDGGYQLHYNHLDYRPYDPDDRDAYLAVGAFLETAASDANRNAAIPRTAVPAGPRPQCDSRPVASALSRRAT